MRNPKRIDDFCEKLKEYWHKVPDWRFGQLINNIYRTYHLGDGFYVEDDKLLEFMADFFDGGDNNSIQAELEKFWEEK